MNLTSGENQVVGMTCSSCECVIRADVLGRLFSIAEDARLSHGVQGKIRTITNGSWATESESAPDPDLLTADKQQRVGTSEVTRTNGELRSV